MSWLTVTLLGLLASSLLCKTGEAGNILLLPTAADNSHIYTLRKVYDEASSRGHDATVRPPSVLLAHGYQQAAL